MTEGKIVDYLPCVMVKRTLAVLMSLHPEIEVSRRIRIDALRRLHNTEEPKGASFEVFINGHVMIEKDTLLPLSLAAGLVTIPPLLRHSVPCFQPSRPLAPTA
ncbi:hypothetical protein AB0N89_11015 [Amycolatopsis sp. NPDC089917]|uniref:hypothetical protein n=1 Tax=Amycolatopsis sp. NPDC089917 TaxID=3155187 RepID=UPI00342A986E